MNHVARMPGRFNDRSMALMGIPDLPEAAFGGDLPPFQRTALVNAMGIKPQGGGGGGLMKVVAVVAAIAIPFAAPVIASSIGLSAGIAAATGISATAAATVGSAIVGAGLGAVNASVTGGNVGRGALMGAIGGGIGGYTSVPASPSGSLSGGYGLSPNTSGTATGLGMPSPTTPSLAGSPSLGSNLSFAPDYSLSAGMTPSGVGMGGTGTGLVYGGGGYGLNPAEAGLTLGGTTQGGLSAQLSSPSPYSLSGMSSTAGAPTAAADPYSLANTSYAGPGSNLPLSTQYGNLSSTAADYSLGSAPAASTTAGLKTAGASEFGLKATSAGTGSLGGVSTAGTGTVAGAAEKLTFTQALAKVPEQLQAKFTDPKALADLTMRAGAQLLTGQLSDAGLSDEEKQLLQARVEEMKQNKEINNELFQTQLREAYDLLGRSDYFDPAYFGQQYAGAAKQRTSAQKEAALRKVNPRNKGSRAALERQYNLQSAREEATAYDKGSMYGFDAGLKLTQQALNALPKSAPTSSADATALSTAYGNIEERKRKSQEGLNKTLGPLFT
jgi:hypothetical protein